IMLYKAVIESSNAASILISDMNTVGLPSLLILVGLPLLMGLATGYGPAFSGVALPLLVPYIVIGPSINSSALLLAFISGMMGVLLSPMHLCFILSTQYFKASLTRMYRYTIPLVLVIEAVVIAVYFMAS
ncbi:MAG: DUF401 family protein, partial [Chloroflexi bacterium]|nr:DUF401 family protein [Chloroflexota bacterium]